LTFTMDGEVAEVLQARDTRSRSARQACPSSCTCIPGVPHEYDVITFDADVSRRGQADRSRVRRSL
jgi:hypothetical protein